MSIWLLKGLRLVLMSRGKLLRQLDCADRANRPRYQFINQWVNPCVVYRVVETETWEQHREGERKRAAEILNKDAQGWQNT